MTAELRLPREERQEVVASLREIGMSVRAIAAATGDSKTTISRQLAGVPNGTPADEDSRDLALVEARMAADNGNRTALDDLIREPLQITDADGALADLGQRVQAQYPGAATTPAQVRAIRESWHQPWWRRVLRRGGAR